MRTLSRACCMLLVSASLSGAGDNKWTSNGPYGGVVSELVFGQTAPNVVFARGYTIFRSVDTGRVWEPLSLAFSGPVRINPKDPDVVIAAGNGVYKSSDRGTTWIELGDAAAEVSDWFSDLEFDTANPQILYGVTAAHGVFKSTDGGVSWIAKNTGIDLSSIEAGDRQQIEVDPENSRVLYVMLQFPEARV